MKSFRLYLPALILMATACNSATFGSRGGKKADGAVYPKSGQVNPAEAPLDLSAEKKNQDLAVDGPKGGEKQVLDKTVDADCSPGITIDIDEPGLPPKDPGKLKLIGDDAPIGYEPVPLDKDGKPVGGKVEKPDYPGKPTEEVPEAAKVTATVKGKFCPKSNAQLNVLFVVDHSGSMGRHIPGLGQPEVAGNDPQVDGSCGRLRAAQAIMAKLTADAKAGDDIRIGMVPFAGGIIPNRVIQLSSKTDFEAKVTKDVFCSYVVQDLSFGLDPTNPGGIDGSLSSIDASTNYTAAFSAAESMLTAAYGRKVVYFISDGEPTSGALDPVLGGIAAGESLRKHVDNLTLNGLLLGSIGTSARGVLEAVAGSPDRVRDADKADELAEAILQFADASIDESTGKAWLSVLPYPKAELGLKYLSPDPTAPGVWIWETQPFILLGQKGEEVENVVTVTAQGKDGSTHQSEVKIYYRQKD